MSRRPAVQVASDSEEEFDDDTDLPLPPRPTLANTGTKGALLEEIGSSSAPSASTSQQQQALANAFASMGLGGAPAGGPPIDEDVQADPRYKQFMAARASLGNATVLEPGSEKLNEFKNWTCIYPIYIDAKRAYGTGQRRIAREKSVWWPRSQEIAQAALKCGLRVFHEPTKRHPRDWENPGRVKVLWKSNGVLVNPQIPTKKVLFEKISSQIHLEKPDWKPDMSKMAIDESASAPAGIPAGDSKPTGGGTGGKHAKGSSGARQQQQQQQRPQTRKKPLPKPPLPLPPLSERLSPYSPIIGSGSLLDLWKPGPLDKSAGGGGGAGGEAGAGMGKGKRKVIRVRG